MILAKPYKLGYWALFSLIILLALALAIYYLHIRYNGYEHLIKYADRAATFIGGIVFLFAIEMWIYQHRRNYIVKKIWVHLHVWILWIAMLLFITIFIMWLPVYKSSYEEVIYYYRSRYPAATMQLLTDIFWLLIIIAHIFFIVTIARSITIQKESQRNGTPGFTDQISDRP
jgi:hypothetical protein